MLEVAAELAIVNPFRHVSVRFADTEPAVVLSSSSTLDGIADVVSRRVTLATMNPSAMLTLAYRGYGPSRIAEPVRTLAVMPSADCLVFAVHPRTGLRRLADLATVPGPLTFAMRGEATHSLQVALADVLRAAGLSRGALEERGIRFVASGGVPVPDSAKFRALVAGEIDGIFDEGAELWLREALAAGMGVAALDEAHVAALESLGYRRALIEHSRYPRLPHDILTLDFSGWALFVHADAEAEVVEKICAALVARKTSIAWDQPGPLPIERMCTDTPDAPYDVPLHPAAERFWRAAGYLNRD
jgi:TRAP-type uncharacterized transport system substrate-binding protein